MDPFCQARAPSEHYQYMLHVHGHSGTPQDESTPSHQRQTGELAHLHYLTSTIAITHFLHISIHTEGCLRFAGFDVLLQCNKLPSHKHTHRRCAAYDNAIWAERLIEKGSECSSIVAPFTSGCAHVWLHTLFCKFINPSLGVWIHRGSSKCIKGFVGGAI